MSLVMCNAHAVVTEDFSRYQGIIDRKPFGVPPQDAASMSNATISADVSFIKTLKMVAIKLSRDGRIRVGFVDSANKNKGYYLRIGEHEDGIEVVDADFHLESALLRKDGQTGWIYLGKSKFQPDVANVAARTPSMDEIRQKQELYAQIMRRKKEVTRQRVVEAPKLSGNALEKHLNDYQLDLIRTGEPPLPIPLTQEMDDQLVAEGVLPPLQPQQ